MTKTETYQFIQDLDRKEENLRVVLEGLLTEFSLVAIVGTLASISTARGEASNRPCYDEFASALYRANERIAGYGGYLINPGEDEEATDV